MKNFLIIAALVLMLGGCEALFFDEEPRNDYLTNFEVFWREFDRNYSFFEVKNIDWDSIYHIYRPQAEQAENEVELFFVLSQMALALEDGHVNVASPYGVSSYNYTGSARDNGPYNVKYYTFNVENIGNTITYAELSQHNVGYIHIKTFGAAREDYEKIDDILTVFSKKDGLIIDVRSNGGGSTNNSQAIASRFADKERLYLKVKYKNGPGHGDFTDWDERTVVPQGRGYDKPVVVLTNRRTFSSAEDFVLAMRLFPNVTVLGDTTGGGSGNPILRELPNGWTFRLSSWIAADPDDNLFEGVGLAPDITVWNSAQDSTALRDRLLREALRVVEGR